MMQTMLEKKNERMGPSYKSTMRLAAFCSGSGTNMKALLDEFRRQVNVDISPLYEIPVVFFDRKCDAMALLEEFNKSTPLSGPDGSPIPVGQIYISGKRFFDANHDGMVNDDTRPHYDSQIAQALDRWQNESGIGLDGIALCGYERIISAPLLEAFPYKILNVHPGDLSKEEDGERKYKGLGKDPIIKAILAGEKETRSSVHLLTEAMDAGPLLGVSAALPLPQPSVMQSLGFLPPDDAGDDFWESAFRELIKDKKLLNDYAKLHQSVQKSHCDWPTYIRVVNDLAAGNFSFTGELDRLGQKKVIYHLKGGSLLP